MSTVDNRIVQMSFDNQQFETAAQKTIESLNGLNNGVDGLNQNSLSNITDSIDNLSNKFSLLGVAGMTAINNITNKVVDMGLKMANNLTFGQIEEGFQKYASATKDVKSLMNATDKDIDTITAEVEKLAWYSDATSYSYASMVSALKNFAAQGIDTTTSINMIMGIGNSLSYAGMAAEEASGMFNVYSKAIGQGYVSLKEWMQLNTQNATNVKLKQQFMDAAVELGTLKKSADGTMHTLGGLDVTMQTFQSTLSDQKGKWLTTDVMTKVFSEYGSYSSQLQDFMAQEENVGLTVSEAMEKMEASGVAFSEFGKKAFLAAQEARTFREAVSAIADASSTAWMGIFQNVLGNAEEATKLWTAFSDWLFDAVMPPVLYLRDLTKEWNEFGGRNSMIDFFSNLAKVLESITAPIKNAFNAIFTPLNGEQLANATDRLAKFTEKLILNEDHAKALEKAFTVLFGTIKTVSGVIGSLVTALGSNLAPILKKVIDLFFDLIDVVAGPIESAFSKIGIITKDTADKFGVMEKTFSDTKEKVKMTKDELVRFGSVKVSLPEPNAGAFATGIDLVTSKLNTFKDANAEAGKEAFEAASKFDDESNAFTVMADIVTSAIDGMAFVLDSIAVKVRDVFNPIIAKCKEVGKAFKENFDFSDALRVAGLILGINFGKELANKFKIGDNLINSVTGVFNALSSGIKQLTQGAGKKGASILMEYAIALGILSLSLTVLSSIKAEDIGTAMFALSGIVTALIVGVQKLSAITMATNGGLLGKMGLSTIGLTLGALAISIFVIAGAVKMLSSLNLEEVASGLAGLFGIIGSLVLFANKMKGLTLSPSLGLSIIAIAIGLRIMAGAITKIAELDLGAIGRGLTGIAGSLMSIAMFSRALKGARIDLGTAISVAIIAGGMSIMANAVSKFGDLNLEELAKGLGSVAVILLEIVGFSKLLSMAGGGQGPISSAVGIFIIAGAIDLLSIAIGKFGGMPLAELGKGLLGMAGALVIIGLALALIPGNFVGAASILILCVAIDALIPALAALSAIPINKLAPVVGLLAGLFAVFGIGMALLSGVALQAIAVSTAFVLFAAAITLMTPALAALCLIPILTLSLHIGALLLALIGFGAIAAILTPVIPMMIALAAAMALIGLGAAAFGAGLLAISIAGAGAAASLVGAIEIFLTAIPNLATDIIKALETMIVSACEAIQNTIPKILETVGVVINAMLDFLIENMPQFVDKGTVIIVSLCEGLAKNMPVIIKAVADLALAILGEIAKLPGWLWEKGKEIIDDFMKGIGEKWDEAIGKIADFGEAIKEKFKELLGINSPSTVFAGFGKNTIEGYTEGVGDTSTQNQALSKIKSFGSAILAKFKKELGIKSPSKAFAECGFYSAMGYAKGLNDNVSIVTDAAANTGESALESIRDSVSAISNLFNDVSENPTITPVMDLTDIQNGSKELNNLMSSLTGGTLSMTANPRTTNRVLEDAVAAVNTSKNQPNNVSFVQNNYSPKSLSSIDIYRQTRNQLLMAKGAI